jgi:four helix bundle suffix protein
MTDTMLNHHLQKLENEFVTQGGIKERMHAARTGFRQTQDEELSTLRREVPALKNEISSLKAEISRLNAETLRFKTEALRLKALLAQHGIEDK